MKFNMPGIKNITVLKLMTVFATILHKTASLESGNRENKLLNVFNIIKFPNDGCNTTTGKEFLGIGSLTNLVIHYIGEGDFGSLYFNSHPHFIFD